jgi:hypothetical protein
MTAPINQFIRAYCRQLQEVAASGSICQQFNRSYTLHAGFTVALSAKSELQLSR